METELNRQRMQRNLLIQIQLVPPPLHRGRERAGNGRRHVVQADGLRVRRQLPAAQHGHQARHRGVHGRELYNF
jgi:hypothetical protein